MRGALLHEQRVGGDGGEGVEAQVARGGAVVLEEVGAEGRAEDVVGLVHRAPVVRRVLRLLPVRPDVQRGHVLHQARERRLLAARERLRVLVRRAQAEPRVQHRRVQEVEARRQPVREVLPLQHHHRQRRERQARDDHARQRAQLVLRARAPGGGGHAAGPLVSHPGTFALF